MISLALSLLLFTLIFQLYLTTQRSIHIQTAFNQIQFDANTAINQLRSSIHKAGYIGCARLSADFPIHGWSNHTLTVRSKLHANTEGPISVSYAEGAHISLLEPMRDHSFMLATKQMHYSVGDILIISNCAHADIFQIKQIIVSHGMQKIIPVSPLRYQYDKYSEIARLIQNEYRIEQGGTLFVKDIHHRRIALADHIDAMRINATVNQHGRYVDVPANAVEDWSKVGGVSIAFIVSSTPYKKIWHAYISVGE